MRRETMALEAGRPVPSPKRRGRGTQKPDPSPRRDDAAELWVFLGQHGHAIAGVLAAAGGEAQQLEIARAYLAIVRSEPGGHEGWASLLAQLSVQGI